MGILESQEQQPQRTQAPDAHSSVWARELYALGGIGDGLKQAAVKMATDAKTGFSDLLHNPLSTLGSYAKNHWEDAAAGAAISFLSPGKWMTTALTAYTMRDLIGATANTLIMAQNPLNDQHAVRNYYSDAVATTGEGMISSLPATMVGGAFGSGLAADVFGRGNGLLDMLPRKVNGEWQAKVTPDMVHQHLSDWRYAFRPRPVQVVFSDLDNTMIRFSKFEAMGVQKSIGDMAAKLHELGYSDVTEEELYKSIGAEMDKARSHDYPWSVELALKDRLRVGQEGGMSASQFRQDIVEPFWKSIDESRQKNMELFPGVKETLEELKRQGKPVVIVTDAPYYAALQRVLDAGLDKYVDGVYALNSQGEPAGLSDQLMLHGRERIAGIMNRPNQLKFFQTVPQSWEKPNPFSFQEALKRYGTDGEPVDPREAMMIGDSRTKDVEGARQAGMIATWRAGQPVNGIWAEYGNPPKYIDDILLRLRPLPEHDSAPGMPKRYPTPLEAATGFGAVLHYLDPQPNPGYLLRHTLRSMVDPPRWQSVLGYNAVPDASELRYFTSTPNLAAAEVSGSDKTK